MTSCLRFHKKDFIMQALHALTLAKSRDSLVDRMMLHGRPSLRSRLMEPKTAHEALKMLGYWRDVAATLGEVKHWTWIVGPLKFT